MLTDQTLPEAVIALQRLDLAPETRKVVEEAARLLGDGREMEARALVEKAEALVSRRPNGNGTASNGNSQGTGKTNGIAAQGPQAMIAPIAAKLAAGFAGVLSNVLEDVHHYTGDQIQAVARAIEERIGTMQSALRNVSTVGERLEQVAAEQQTQIQAVQRTQEEIWGAVRALQRSEQDQNACMSRMAATSEALSSRVAAQTDAVASRFAAVEERIGVLDRVTQEMQPQISNVIARLDRQTEALRAIEQRQAQRVSTLNQVLDSLVRLKEPEPELQQALAATA